MEVLAVIDILLKAASAAGTIAQGSQFIYNYIKKVKNPQELMIECKGLLGDLNRRLDEIYVGTDQLSDKMEHHDHITTRRFDQLSEGMENLALTTTGGLDQLSERMEDLALTTTGGFDQLSERVDGLANTTTSRLDHLSGRVEGLAQITASGFERVSEAFSQVIAL